MRVSGEAVETGSGIGDSLLRLSERITRLCGLCDGVLPGLVCSSLLCLGVAHALPSLLNLGVALL
jgi:hypothetical protein